MFFYTIKFLIRPYYNEFLPAQLNDWFSSNLSGI